MVLITKIFSNVGKKESIALCSLMSIFKQSKQTFHSQANSGIRMIQKAKLTSTSYFVSLNRTERKLIIAMSCHPIICDSYLAADHAYC